MEEQALASLEEAFNELDESGSGTLGIEEFQDLLFACGNTASPDEAQAMFRSIDSDGSGGIDKEEFIAFMCGLKDDEGEEVDSALGSMILRAQLQASLLSRMMARRLKAAAAARTGGVDDRQENESQSIDIEFKIGDPKVQGGSRDGRPKKSRFFLSSLTSSSEPATPNLGIKALLEFFPGRTDDWPSKVEIAFTLPRREGVPRAKMEQLVADWLQILEQAKEYKPFKDALKAANLDMGKWKHALSEMALTFSVIVTGKAVVELQSYIRNPMEIPLDEGLPVKSSISVEANLGLSVDALTSEDEAVWQQTVLSHLDKGTFFKVHADLAAGLTQAVKKLPDSILGREFADGWLKYFSRLGRYAKLELGFLRTQDALRHLFEERQNMQIPDPEVRRFVQSLRDLKVGHLATFAQLVPRAIGYALWGVQQNASLIEQLEMMLFFPPAKWAEMLNNLSSCVTGLGELKVSLNPGVVATLSLTGLDILKALKTAPLKPEDIKRDEMLESDFEQLFRKLFKEGNATMATTTNPQAGRGLAYMEA
ncbi:putative calcium-binding protein cml23-like protein [Chrysochromulina tobinii]|uniref:Putative calcium-binding protein cml23-like protein n=1 Tax=Chrysochromulina tobinii TaxID=1460289 RepID=A0A0M0JBG5_9EUKA|nr:putative calcium-binding protein cml23-like protein [Chrysochromulina tobinii]|eukprot:KOO23553.1 putative calcium-binding protein cml23-like protein [Chrysochromulina sp. CCMP291]